MRNTLLHLDLSKNDLPPIREQVQLIPHTLLSLNLGGNELNKNITPGIFDKFTHVEKIQLRRAGLEIIGAGTFLKQTNLLVLNLRYNSLRNITGVMWEGLGKLRKLDLANNRIKALHAGAFLPLGNLVELILRLNRLLILDTSALRGLTKLERIDIGDDILPVIRTTSFDCKLKRTYWFQDTLLLRTKHIKG